MVGREGGREGGREETREDGRSVYREKGRKVGREKGRKGGREEGTKIFLYRESGRLSQTVDKIEEGVQRIDHNSIPALEGTVHINQVEIEDSAMSSLITCIQVCS